MPELNNSSLFNDANLEAYWRFEGNSNDSKNSNDGTDTDITYNSGYGKFTQGARFNGTSSYIQVSDSANLNPSGDMTVVFWVKYTSGTYLLNKDDVTSNRDWSIDIGTYPACFFWVGGSYSRRTGSQAINDSNWHHIAFVRRSSDGNIDVYTDGQLTNGTQSSTASGSLNNSTAPMTMGRRNYAADYGYVSCDLDDVAIFSRVLTAQEIYSLYSHKIICGTGSFTLTGQSTNFLRGLRLVCEAGSFTLTGMAVNLLKGYKLACETGSFVLTGFSATFKLLWSNLAKNVASWTNGSKNSASFTNQSKNNSN